MSLCSEHVQRHDQDRYLCAMFTKEPVRERLMALYAFNTELGLIHERVSENLLGEMRLQWWRDQVSIAYEGSTRPAGFAGALYDFIDNLRPTRENFDTLIDCRTRDLSDDLFRDMAQLEAYFLGIDAPVFYLTLYPFAFPAQPGTVPGDLVENMCLARALTDLIRAIPVHAAQGRCLIPQSVLDKHGVSRNTVFREESRSTLIQIVEYLGLSAERRLSAARVQVRAIDKSLFPAFLPLTLTGFYLSAIRKAGYNPFHHRVQMPNRAKRALRLMYAAWFRSL